MTDHKLQIMLNLMDECAKDLYSYSIDANNFREEKSEAELAFTLGKMAGSSILLQTWIKELREEVQVHG